MIGRNEQGKRTKRVPCTRTSPGTSSCTNTRSTSTLYRPRVFTTKVSTCTSVTVNSMTTMCQFQIESSNDNGSSPAERDDKGDASLPSIPLAPLSTTGSNDQQPDEANVHVELEKELEKVRSLFHTIKSHQSVQYYCPLIAMVYLYSFQPGTPSFQFTLQH